jgi:hypothetical protein
VATTASCQYGEIRSEINRVIGDWWFGQLAVADYCATMHKRHCCIVCAVFASALIGRSDG